jgi:hypothetical protein
MATSSAPAAKKSAKAGNYVRGPQPALYADPKTGATWSGRGRAPAWIASAKDRSKFLIAEATEVKAESKATAAKKAAPAKKAAGKKIATKRPASKKKVSGRELRQQRRRLGRERFQPRSPRLKRLLPRRWLPVLFQQRLLPKRHPKLVVWLEFDEHWRL